MKMKRIIREAGNLSGARPEIVALSLLDAATHLGFSLPRAKYIVSRWYARQDYHDIAIRINSRSFGVSPIGGLCFWEEVS